MAIFKGFSGSRKQSVDLKIFLTGTIDGSSIYEDITTDFMMRRGDLSSNLHIIFDGNYIDVDNQYSKRQFIDVVQNIIKSENEALEFSEKYSEVLALFCDVLQVREVFGPEYLSSYVNQWKPRKMYPDNPPCFYALEVNGKKVQV